MTPGEMVLDDWVDSEGVVRGEDNNPDNWKRNLTKALDEDLVIECRENNYPKIRVMLLDAADMSPEHAEKLHDTVNRLDNTFKYVAE